MIWGGFLLATACWAITFGLREGNFWLKIGLSVLIVSSYSLFWQRPKLTLQWRFVGVGLLSAVLLYATFWVGNRLAPFLLPEAKAQVQGIYSLGAGTDRTLIFLLLFFITGPGEELFWRGFLQQQTMVRCGRLRGYLITTLIYAGVHAFSQNLVLILAALIAGAFWGLLYLWKADLLLQIVSHSVWSSIIFAVVPIE